MKSKVRLLGIVFFITLLFTHEPPIETNAQRMYIKVLKIDSVTFLSPKLSALIDSVNTVGEKVDSMNTTCKEKLVMLRKQQKSILKQIKLIDTLSTVKN